MQIHQIIKDAMSNHKQKIELTQWAIMAGVSSLVYSEYLRQIKQKQVPVRKILVPSIKNVNELLHPEGQFIQLLSNKLIDGMVHSKVFKKYSDAPELVLFTEENIEVMKTIFDLYIIPNIVSRIPETISKKFQLDNEDQQMFIQNREADLFERRPISDEQLDYIIEECVLQLLFLLPTMKKDIELPEKNIGIFLAKDEIISIDNENAICAIHLNEKIIENQSVIDLLKFITSTTIKDILTGHDSAAQKNGSIVHYSIDTNVFNQVAVVRFDKIEC